MLLQRCTLVWLDLWATSTVTQMQTDPTIWIHVQREGSETQNAANKTLQQKGHPPLPRKLAPWHFPHARDAIILKTPLTGDALRRDGANSGKNRFHSKEYKYIQNRKGKEYPKICWLNHVESPLLSQKKKTGLPSNHQHRVLRVVPGTELRQRSRSGAAMVP